MLISGVPFLFEISLSAHTLAQTPLATPYPPTVKVRQELPPPPPQFSVNVATETSPDFQKPKLFSPGEIYDRASMMGVFGDNKPRITRNYELSIENAD
ncbi:MAG: hypothetical protein ACFBSE_12950 [Prochloraceae cyanobacterium]